MRLNSLFVITSWIDRSSVDEHCSWAAHRHRECTRVWRKGLLQTDFLYIGTSILLIWSAKGTRRRTVADDLTIWACSRPMGQSCLCIYLEKPYWISALAWLHFPAPTCIKGVPWFSSSTNSHLISTAIYYNKRNLHKFVVPFHHPDSGFHVHTARLLVFCTYHDGWILCSVCFGAPYCFCDWARVPLQWHHVRMRIWFNGGLMVCTAYSIYLVLNVDNPY